MEAQVHSFAAGSPLLRLQASIRRLARFRSDVLVVGSGAAGLAAAIEAADSGAHVIVLCKGGVDDTNTRFAQGGIAASVGRDDSPDFHAADTVKVGYGLCDPGVVDELTGRAGDTVDWLLKMGTQFDCHADGSLSLGREGGHRVARILHSHGTATGLELQRALHARARSHPNIDLIPRATAIELLKDAEGRVCGLVSFLHRNGDSHAEVVIFQAGAVAFATGGGGQIFRETTNPQLATGGGLAMALRAGATLRDLEFVQFHPTILYLAGAARFLISEVTRGAGAVLKDRSGNAFMQEAHPDAELAPRDVVSRAIFRRMVDTGDTHVYLDFSDVADPQQQFPALAKIAREFGMELGKDAIPVRPAVHYLVGGIQTDLHGQTSIPGLWATGECASTGFHGANRMGSNSLLEGLVHGRMVGQAISQTSFGPERRFLFSQATSPLKSTGAELNLLDMTYSLKSLMWRQVGIERSEAGLSEALERLHLWNGYLSRLGPFTPGAVEVVNMVQVGATIAHSALFRRESRGAHFRTDYAATTGNWQCHTLLDSQAGSLHVRASAPVLSQPQAVPLAGD